MRNTCRLPINNLYRGGISHAGPGVRALTATFGGRMEGVPVRDLIGRSEGLRRPGVIGVSRRF